MKFIVVILAILSFIFAVSSDPTYKMCPDTCGDDFDEVVCATDGDEMRSFSGRCRLQQYNKCEGTSKMK